MANVKLSNKYILKSDIHCVWIEEIVISTKGKNKGKEYSKAVTGYYRDYQDLFNDLFDKQVRGAEAETVGELLEKIETIREEILEAVSGLGKVKI